MLGIFRKKVYFRFSPLNIVLRLFLWLDNNHLFWCCANNMGHRSIWRWVWLVFSFLLLVETLIKIVDLLLKIYTFFCLLFIRVIINNLLFLKRIFWFIILLLKLTLSMRYDLGLNLARKRFLSILLFSLFLLVVLFTVIRFWIRFWNITTILFIRLILVNNSILWIDHIFLIIASTWIFLVLGIILLSCPTVFLIHPIRIDWLILYNLVTFLLIFILFRCLASTL